MGGVENCGRTPQSASALRVLFEDAELLAVDKPAGLHTAPLRHGETGTLLQLVIARYPEVAAVPGVKPVEPGLLHRLDRDTSGVVVVARNASAFAALLLQFRAEEVRKEYLALCRAAAAAKPGDRLHAASRFAPSGPGRRKVRVVTGEGKAREATAAVYSTEVEVLQVRGGLALVRAVIVRGFRHQVRAHLAHLGLPIVGDALYGSPPVTGGALHTPEASPRPDTRGAAGAPLPADGPPARLLLHAAVVELHHPVSGQALRFEAPLPSDFGRFGFRQGGISL